MARISQENKDETKAAIIKQSMKLFNDLGYAKTNTKTIAKQCNIAEGTIFNYFATKDDILMAVFEDLSMQPDLTEMPVSLQPIDNIIDILIIPLSKLNRVPKQFVMDILISAMKLSKKNNTLLHKLLTLDMTYVKKAEEQMKVILIFEGNKQNKINKTNEMNEPKETHGITEIDDSTLMNASILSEILYATIATDYLLYIFNETMSFSEFEGSVRNKLRLLMNPYLKNPVIQR